MLTQIRFLLFFIFSTLLLFSVMMALSIGQIYGDACLVGAFIVLGISLYVTQTGLEHERNSRVNAGLLAFGATILLLVLWESLTPFQLVYHNPTLFVILAAVVIVMVITTAQIFWRSGPMNWVIWGMIHLYIAIDPAGNWLYYWRKIYGKWAAPSKRFVIAIEARIASASTSFETQLEQLTINFYSNTAHQEQNTNRIITAANRITMFRRNLARHICPDYGFPGPDLWLYAALLWDESRLDLCRLRQVVGLTARLEAAFTQINEQSHYHFAQAVKANQNSTAVPVYSLLSAHAATIAAELEGNLSMLAMRLNEEAAQLVAFEIPSEKSEMALRLYHLGYPERRTHVWESEESEWTLRLYRLSLQHLICIFHQHQDPQAIIQLGGRIQTTSAAVKADCVQLIHQHQGYAWWRYGQSLQQDEEGLRELAQQTAFENFFLSGSHLAIERLKV